eukprot:1333942-Amorphochlora_amoeboformis.AAC.1
MAAGVLEEHGDVLHVDVAKSSPLDLHPDNTSSRPHTRRIWPDWVGPTSLPCATLFTSFAPRSKLTQSGCVEVVGTR